MATAQPRIEPLIEGQRLTREEFLRRWEGMPELKKAELIGGVVHMQTLVSLDHGDSHSDLATWLGVYAAATPGCKAGDNATVFMLEDAPQPDAHLRILPEYGGRARIGTRIVRGQVRRYLDGAPELTAEVSLSSTWFDLEAKLNLYRSAGVLEYLVVLVGLREVRWHQLVNGDYELLPADASGVIRSVTFPGLWLDVPAFLADDMAQVLRTLQVGISSPEHAEFVARLARNKS